MAETTCTFSYISKNDFAPKTATGVERSWLGLKLEFNRQGEGLAGATYYKTISKEGPQLFAVKNDESVWYHDEGKWRLYQTATDIKYGRRHSDTESGIEDDNEIAFGQEDAIQS